MASMVIQRRLKRFIGYQALLNAMQDYKQGDYAPPPVKKRLKKGVCPLKLNPLEHCHGKTCRYIKKACAYSLIMYDFRVYDAAMEQVYIEKNIN
jgi:hypothetical protein